MQERRFPGAVVAVGVVLAGVILALGAGLQAEMQTSKQTASQQNTLPVPASASNPLGGTTGESGIDEAAVARLKHRQELAGLDERHKHMVADAEKLLEMATELKSEVDKSSKNETSVSAYNKADAIERLAHDVKQRLRN